VKEALAPLDDALTSSSDLVTDLERRLQLRREDPATPGPQLIGARTAFAGFFEGFRKTATELGKPIPELRVSIPDSLRLSQQLTAALKDMLLHLITNSLDHGLEPAAERLAKGKAQAGVITITVSIRSDGAVIMDYADDGRGVDIREVKAKAMAMGLKVEDERPSAVASLIFREGFTTAKTITPLSGRGIGMNAVHSMLTELGGRVTWTAVKDDTNHLPLALHFVFPQGLAQAA
jgi:chemotaxis protein histidine kinase CheA